MSKICIIIPGTFNPFTKAHEEMGRQAVRYVLSGGTDTLADLIYVPSSTSFMQNWGKQANMFLSDDERLRCIRETIPGVGTEHDATVRTFVSDIEINGTVSGATIDTVDYIAQHYGPYDTIYLCLGEDKLEQLPRWRRAEELFGKVTTIIFTRKSTESAGTAQEAQPARMDRAAQEARPAVTAQTAQPARMDGAVQEACVVGTAPTAQLTQAPGDFFTGNRHAAVLPLNLGNVSSSVVRQAWYEDRLADVRDMISEKTYELLENKQFDAAAVTEKLITWLRTWFDQNGPGCSAVVGISGGKDSTVAAAVCAAALGRDRVVGVLMPNGIQPDIADSRRVCEVLGIKSFEVNIHEAVEGVYAALSVCDGLEISTQARVNLPPRIRMSTLYAVSQSVNGRVINTCNLSEDWVGYSTRYGDSVGDVSPLSHLTVREVRAVGRYLGVPAELVDKAPSDGLTGRTDEDNLGFTYAQLDRYIRTGDCENAQIRALIDRRHAANLFKLQLMPSFDP